MERGKRWSSVISIICNNKSRLYVEGAESHQAVDAQKIILINAMTLAITFEWRLYCLEGSYVRCGVWGYYP